MSEPDFAALDAAADDVISSGETIQPPTPTPDSAAKPEAVVSKAPEPPKPPKTPTRRFRGQFMDMVHPSSNVSLANKPNNAAANNPFKSSTVAATSALETTKTPTAPSPESVKAETPASANPEKTIDEKSNNDAYESPFLPNANVDKRPLGSPNADNDLKLLSDDEPEEVLLPSGKEDQELLSSDEEPKELLVPGDEPDELLNSGAEKPDELLESGQESKASLPAGDENRDQKPIRTEQIEKPDPAKTDKTDHLPRRAVQQTPAGDTRAAINNTMIMPQYKSATAAVPATNQSPYADAAQPIKKPAKHFPAWAWVIVFLLLAAAGVALGALLYTSGWLM